MATRLRKRVVRVADLGLTGASKGEHIVTIYPGGAIGFRKLRARTEYVISLAACHSLAVKAHVAQRGRGRQA